MGKGSCGHANLCLLLCLLCFAGKLVVGDALRQYGINAETVREGRNADAMSPFAGFDRQQRRKVDHMIDCTYATFKQVGGVGVGWWVGG